MLRAMLPALLPALIATAIALTTPSSLGAQEGPADVYRAFWASQLSPADPAATRFRSKTALNRIAELRRESPEDAVDMLEFMAAMHARLQAAAEISNIEVSTEAPDRATLVVQLTGKDGPIPNGLPSRATIEMVREPDGWKIDVEAYSVGRVSVESHELAPDADSEMSEAATAPSCPAPSALGDTDAPHVLVLGGTAGDGQVHFSDARVRLNEGWMTVELPIFNEHSISIRASDAAATPGRYEANLTVEGMMGFVGCPTLPTRFFNDDFSQPAPVRQVTWEAAADAGRANVSFSFSDPVSGDVDLSGSLRGVPLVDVTPAPLLDGSLMSPTGSPVAPTRGSALFEAARERLMIELWYETANESSNEIIELDEFTGSTGLIVADRFPGTARVALVREFAGTRVDVEMREVPEDALANREALAARFSTIGNLVARVRSDRVATIPPLPDLTP